LGLISCASIHITLYKFHYVSNDDDMFMLSMGSLDGVDPCVEPNPVLFASFYVPSILLSVENFDASSHFDLDLSQAKKILLL